MARDNTNQLQVTWRLFLVVIKKITNPLPKTVTREIIILKDQYHVIWGSSEKCFCNGCRVISVVLFIELGIVISVHASNFPDLYRNYVLLFLLFRFLFTWIILMYSYIMIGPPPKYLNANMKWRDSQFTKVHSQSSGPQKNRIQPRTHQSALIIFHPIFHWDMFNTVDCFNFCQVKSFPQIILWRKINDNFREQIKSTTHSNYCASFLMRLSYLTWGSPPPSKLSSLNSLRSDHWKRRKVIFQLNSSATTFITEGIIDSEVPLLKHVCGNLH